MKLNNFLLTLPLFISTSTIAQEMAIDAEGKSIFNFNQLEKTSLEISSDEAVSLTRTFKNWELYTKQLIKRRTQQ